MVEHVRISKHPPAVSAALAVGAAAVAVELVATETTPRLAVLATCIAIAALGVGLRMRAADRHSIGTVLVGVGALGTLTAPLAGPLVASDVGVAIGTVVGQVGISLVGLALLAPLGRRARAVLRVGAGVVFVAVLACGVTLTASQPALLLAAGAAIVSFDVGENAIGIGQQLGSEAGTTRIELAHALGSVAVGGIGVLGCLIALSLGDPGLSLTPFVLLLAVLILLATALHD